MVSLSEESDRNNEVDDVEIPFSFFHCDYVFLPYQEHLQMLNNAAKEAQSQSSKPHKSYRRPAPMIMENHGYGYANSDANSEHSYQSNRRYNNRGKTNYYPNSPGRQQQGYRNSGQKGMNGNIAGSHMYPIPIPIAPPNMGPYPAYPAIPIFPPMPFIQGAPFFPPPPPQMHSSLSSSLSSSYGQNSPLSQSPMNPSFMHMPPIPHSPSDYMQHQQLQHQPHRAP
jgi:hypothetical protein